MEKMYEICESAFFGHIVGDAVGVPYEFIPREERESVPCVGMVGYGSHNMPSGTWSDDTSLTIAGAVGLTISLWKNESGLENIEDLIDYNEVMMNFARWFAFSEFTPYNRTWGVGFATHDAILRYLNGTDPLLSGGVGERDNGNGSVMRLLPIILFVYFLSQEIDISTEDKMRIIHNYTSLTHRHKRSQMACGIYSFIAFEILDNCYNEDSHRGIESLIYDGITNAMNYYYMLDEFEEEIPHFKRIMSRNIQHLSKDKIRSGGYVISTIEASIWCLCNNDNYKDTILEAVNLGFDTDTTACTVGALAGIYYGFENIPVTWLDGLVYYNYLNNIVISFSDALMKTLTEVELE